MSRRSSPRASRFLSLVFFFALLASCSAPVAPTPTPMLFSKFILVTPDANAPSTPTPFQPLGETETAIPSLTPEPPTSTPTQILPTETVAPTALVPTQVPGSAARTNYTMYAALDFSGHTLAVEESIVYYNNTGVALNDLVLSVQPNLYSNVFILNSILQDGAPLANYSLDGQRLTMSQPQPLQPGAGTLIAVSFNLNIPAKGSADIFGHDFNQINLVDWYPFVVPYNNGWVLHEPSSVGEYLVYDAADFEVNIKTDPSVIIAAGASGEQNGDWVRYRLSGARTFALSASDEFRVAETTAGAVLIRSYYFDGYQSGSDGFLVTAAEAVSTYESNFAPYPYQILSVVQADIHDGQEYDGMILLATDFYAQYAGGSRNNLTTIGVHEIAHQWWYGLVGSDQAMTPWLDEALSTYSERIFYENNYPGNISWWWQFRVDYFKPGGYVDMPVYNAASQRQYVNAAYLNGAHFIDELRERVGYGNFAKFLKLYAERYARKQATPADFFATLREVVDVDISDLISNYFSQSY